MKESGPILLNLDIETIMNSFSLLAQEAAVAESTSSAISSLDSVNTFFLVMSALVLGVVLTICITVLLHRVYTTRATNALIMELVNKGFSAEEIERVVHSNAKPGSKPGQLYANRKNQAGGKPVPPVKAAS